MEQLTIVIPELIVDRQRTPVDGFKSLMQVRELETLLSRAFFSPLSSPESEGVIRALMGLDEEEFPAAAFSYVGDGGDPGDAWWIRIDPVYFHPDRDSLLLLGNDTLEINQEEAQALAAELEAHFSDLNWRIDVQHPKRWYLRLEQDPQIHTYDLAKAKGKHVFQFLPDGPQGHRWHGLLNEMQMLLHNSSVNQARQTRGETTINGVWPWGEGRLPVLKQKPYSFYGGDVIVRGLGMTAGVSCHNEVQSLQQLMQVHQGATLPVIFLGELEAAMLAQDMPTWVEQLNQLESAWFAPLRQVLKTGEVKKLNIYVAKVGVFSTDRTQQRRFWCRRRSLLDYASEK